MKFQCKATLVALTLLSNIALSQELEDSCVQSLSRLHGVEYQVVSNRPPIDLSKYQAIENLQFQRRSKDLSKNDQNLIKLLKKRARSVNPNKIYEAIISSAKENAKEWGLTNPELYLKHMEVYAKKRASQIPEVEVGIFLIADRFGNTFIAFHTSSHEDSISAEASVNAINGLSKKYEIQPKNVSKVRFFHNHPGKSLSGLSESDYDAHNFYMESFKVQGALSDTIFEINAVEFSNTPGEDIIHTIVQQ